MIRTARYFLPFLESYGRIPKFSYCVIIDDDVPLPADLHIPFEILQENKDIKAVHYPITATCPDGNPGLMVKCQDIEYKLAAVHKYFQSTIARVLTCHAAGPRHGVQRRGLDDGALLAAAEGRLAHHFVPASNCAYVCAYQLADAVPPTREELGSDFSQKDVLLLA